MRTIDIYLLLLHYCTINRHAPRDVALFAVGSLGLALWVFANYLINPADEPASHNLSIFPIFILIAGIFGAVALRLWFDVRKTARKVAPSK